MPQPVERVVSERQGDGHLGQDLKGERPGGEGSGDDAALEVPADGGRDEVEGAEGVESTGQSDARHAVERGAVPRDLRLVDAEVGGDGAVQALLGEDLLGGFGVGDGLGCGVSGWLQVLGTGGMWFGWCFGGWMG